MRIGKFEIRRYVAPWAGSLEQQQLGLLGVFAVPDTADWWRAVHMILDMAERETVESARRASKDPNKCMAAVNAGDGINLVRIKFKEARANALHKGRFQQIQRP